MALRDRLRARALALFEPVAVPFLRAIGDGEAFAAARAVFDDYIATFEAGDSQAVRKMADYWFGVGAFEQMPGPMKEYLVAHTAHNVSDVRATFREQYTAESLRALAVPVLVVCGAGSPEVTRKICAGISSQAPRGSLVTLEKANHAMPTTHADAVAALIADLAETAARSPARPDV